MGNNSSSRNESAFAFICIEGCFQVDLDTPPGLFSKLRCYLTIVSSLWQKATFDEDDAAS